MRLRKRKGHARRLARFRATCFCAVERSPDHPRRPPGYRPLDPFWRKRGYTRRAELRTTFTWKDLDEATESPEIMVFWTRVLEPARDAS